jgi:hypothetical protein
MKLLIKILGYIGMIIGGINFIALMIIDELNDEIKKD